MSTQLITINIFSLGIIYLAALIIWPSRKNIFNILLIPFFITAIFIPILNIDYYDFIPIDILAKYTQINLVGACGVLSGLSIYFLYELHHPAKNINSIPLDINLHITYLLRKKVILLTFISLTVLYSCWIYLGPPPLISENIPDAKFFKGEYKTKYDDIKIIYRLFFTSLTLLLPIVLLLLFFDEKKYRFIFFILTVLGLIYFLLTLQRTHLASGLILLAALYASKSNLKCILFLTVLLIIYILGSNLYYLLGIKTMPENYSIINGISSGLPDIKDQLKFLYSFEQDYNIFTHGKTFIGGLIPNNYQYNPAVYTLAITNNTTDISNIQSGGFRLPLSIHGYIAFGLLGSFFVGLFNGLIIKFFINTYRAHSTDDLFKAGMLFIWYKYIALFMIQFYHLKYSSLLLIVILFYLFYRPKKHVQE